jgi:hypothetical protein
MTIQAFPLQWPVGWPRHNGPHKDAAFRTGAGKYRSSHSRSLSVSDGVDRVRVALQRMNVSDYNLIISTNVPLRMDGFPRSNLPEPSDSGAAVYWKDRNSDTRHCMAIDQYFRVADNLAAIAATLEALRAVERYGGAKIVDRAFTGFTALPPGRSWREFFGFKEGQPVTRDQLELAYRTARSAAHPDKGGSSEAFQAVEAAYAEAQKRLF